MTMLATASLAHADIRPLLRNQGFDHPLNGRETIKYVGHIAQGRNDFQIYTYDGVFRAAVVDHGVSRLIVILNGSVFVGEYTSSLPTRCKVRGQEVVCDAGVIAFTPRGPPREAFFDGDIQEIEFGDKLKK